MSLFAAKTHDAAGLRFPTRDEMRVEWSDNVVAFTCPCDCDPETADDRYITLRLNPFEFTDPCACTKCGRVYTSAPQIIVSIGCDGHEVAEL